MPAPDFPIPRIRVSEPEIRRRWLLSFLLSICALCNTSCFTKKLWDRARAETGYTSRRADLKVDALALPRHGQLAVDFHAEGSAHRAVLNADPLTDIHSWAVIKSAEPRSIHLALTLREQSTIRGRGTLISKGVIGQPLRMMPGPPAVQTSKPQFAASAPHCQVLLNLLSAHEYPLDIVPLRGAWLVDGHPTRAIGLIRHAFGSVQEQPDFELLKRIEWWVEATDGAESYGYALRGNALWMAEHAQCHASAKDLFWVHRSTGEVHKRGSAKREIDWPREELGFGGEVTWRSQRDPFWLTTVAVVATPISVSADIILTLSGIGLVIAILYYGNSPQQVQACALSVAAWHFLYFLSLPHQQGSLRPGRSTRRSGS